MVDIQAQFDLNLRKSIKKKKQVAIIPIGSIEQHGPHLPISTDSDIVTEVAKRLSEMKGYLLLPTLIYGVSFEHAPFFNLSIRESTLRTILTDLCSSLLTNNIKTVFIINGHHGNLKSIKNINVKTNNLNLHISIDNISNNLVKYGYSFGKLQMIPHFLTEKGLTLTHIMGP